MTSKILRSDNTPIPNIKSVSYREKISSTTDLRPGCVSSAYIEVTVYGAQSTAPSAGEPLKYYQVSANGVEKYIGTFYAEPSIQSRSTYTFVAFDIVDRLNVNFSERLLAIQDQFPMSLGDIVTEACSAAGVQLLTTNFPMHEMSVQSFYVEGLTCRDILSYAAEIACRFVRCDSNEKIIFDWYAEKENYRIYPTSQDGAETKIAYKQNGLNYQSFSVSNVGCVAVRPLNTENAAYIYPTTFSAVTATDPLLNGVVTLYNLIAVDDGNGNITLSGDFNTTETDGTVEITSEGGGSASNTLVIANNILLTNADSETMEDVAEWIYTEMLDIPVYRPAKAELFPAENPFRAGDIVAVTDIQGVSFSMPVMSMTVDQSVAVVEATGNKTYDADYGSDTAKQLQNLSNSIVQIDRLKVGYAEIGEAVIGTLEANGIDADWINAGHISVDKIDFNYYANGLNIPDVNDPTTLLAGQSIVDGWIVSPDGLMISGNASSIPGRLFITFETYTPVISWAATVGASHYAWDATAFGHVDSNGVLDGATYQYDENGDTRYIQTVNTRCGGATSLSFYGSTRFRNVRVYSDTSSEFTFGYGTTVNIGSSGLQVGKFVVDKTGNVTANGKVVFTGNVNQIGNLSQLSTTAKTDLVSAINEVNAKPIPTIGYVDDASARIAITLTSGGYYNISVPTLPTGAKITSVAILAWTSADGAFNVVPYGAAGTQAYIIGTPNTTINGLQLRFWYEIGV